MKALNKVLVWVFIISLLAAIVSMGVMGLSIAGGDYDKVSAWAYALLVSWIAIVICLLYRVLTRRCPHCGKLRRTGGNYCSYCGKDIGK